VRTVQAFKLEKLLIACTSSPYLSDQPTISMTLVDWRAIPRARAVAHSEVIQVY